MSFIISNITLYIINILNIYIGACAVKSKNELLKSVEHGTGFIMFHVPRFLQILQKRKLIVSQLSFVVYVENDLTSLTVLINKSVSAIKSSTSIAVYP